VTWLGDMRAPPKLQSLLLPSLEIKELVKQSRVNVSSFMCCWCLRKNYGKNSSFWCCDPWRDSCCYALLGKMKNM
jgi:hypothetical protein